jgi:hypothetical protein
MGSAIAHEGLENFRLSVIDKLPLVLLLINYLFESAGMPVRISNYPPRP